MIRDNPHHAPKGDQPDRSHENNVQSAAHLARISTGIRTAIVEAEGLQIPLVARMTGDRLEFFDMKKEADKWRGRPERRKGTATALTLQSFIDLCNRHKDPDSAIFATVSNKPQLLAVFDYHRENADQPVDVARFGEHRLRYEFPFSDEWQIWSKMDGEIFEQGEFAMFIENHIMDLAALTSEDDIADALKQYVFAVPAQIMDLSRGLEVRASATVKNIANLQNGAAQIAFEEQHLDTDGRPLSIPGAFMLAIPMFDGGDVVRIPCRLRYRKQGGKLVWFYQMFRAKALMRDRVIADLDYAGDQTDLPTFVATPEA